MTNRIHFTFFLLGAFLNRMAARRDMKLGTRRMVKGTSWEAMLSTTQQNF